MKTKINAILLLLVILVYTGCDEDFLNVEPPSSLTSNNFYQTSEDAVSAINSVYAPLQNLSMYSDNYPKLVEGGTDDVIINNTTALSLDSWSFSSDVGPIDPVWQASYEGIFRANLILQEIPDIEMDGDLKNRILGEAHFLRALYYWHLTTQFGEVPLMTEADPSDVSTAMVPKSSVDDIYTLMIKDLGNASNLLPQKSEYSSSNIGRATQGAADALLGKVYLYDENYEMAEQLLNDVITSNEYALIDDFSNLWVVDNNEENIFEVQYNNVGGSAWASEDGASINESNLRLRLNLPQGRGGFANLMPTQDIVDAFEDYNGVAAINGRDPRLFHSIFRDGDPYDDIDPEYDESWSPTGYTMKKGMAPIERDQDFNTRNIVLIRFADVLLMYAEAANENGNTTDAVDAINRVRARVGMPDLPTAEYPVGTQEEIFDAIVHERRVELAFEYHRLNDLKRWADQDGENIAVEQLGPLGYESPKHRYFPIPQQEVNTNPELEQNPNY